MPIKSASTSYGSGFTATPLSALTTGSFTIGNAATQQSFPTADIGYAISSKLISSSTTATLDIQTGVCTGSVAYVAGVAQVVTATVTAPSGATASGNCTVTVTGAALTGSPIAVSIPVTTSANTAELVARALASGLNTVAAITEKYAITSVGVYIILTVKADTNGSNLANDGTLNIEIAGGLGITAAATSANTTAGIANSGVQVLDGDGKDFEGAVIPTMARLYSLELNVTSGSATATNGTQVLPLPCKIWNASGFTGSMLTADLVITATSAGTNLTIVAIGKST